jgi:hypothetical protein
MQGFGRYVISDVTDLNCCGRHDLSAEFGPISDGCRAELMLLLDSLSRNAANYVREEKNLHKNDERNQLDAQMYLLP